MREALRDLALLRLVEAEPFRSARVRRFSQQDVLDIYGVRAALDDLAARRACSELAGDVGLLEARARGDARRGARRAIAPALIRHDLAFHRQILESAGNPALTQCWATLGVEAMLTLTIYRPMTDPLDVAESHVAIVEAMRARRPAAAGREARRHVELYAKLARRTAVGSLSALDVTSTSTEPSGAALDARAHLRRRARPRCSWRRSRCGRRSSARAR